MTVAKILEQLKSTSKSILGKSFYGFALFVFCLVLIPAVFLVVGGNGLIYLISVTLFKVKIIFYPEQKYAFDQLVVIAKEELEKVKSMTNEELIAKVEIPIENLILNKNIEVCGRAANINTTIYGNDRLWFIKLCFSVDYFKSPLSDSERGVYGFKILEDGSRLDLTDEKMKRS